MFIIEINKTKWGLAASHYFVLEKHYKLLLYFKAGKEALLQHISDKLQERPFMAEFFLGEEHITN